MTAEMTAMKMNPPMTLPMIMSGKCDGELEAVDRSVVEEDVDDAEDRDEGVEVMEDETRMGREEAEPVA